MWGRRRFGMLASGDRIEGRYRVERLIGEGGMGAVYAVVDGQGRAYALKVLLDTSDANLVKRFAREAQTTAKLQSRHVPRVYGTGSLPDGSPYILMELLHGEDLAELLQRQGTLTVSEIVGHVTQACDALAEAHGLGMVHRDIKPANLFLAILADGTRCVKLLDFGISKPALSPLAPRTQLTQTGSILGSPEYMAPEQLLSSADVDARADIWGLGVSMYELLTGTLPFAADTLAELLSAIMRDPPRSLRRRRADLPEALIAIVERCLEKDPELRFDSVEDLRAALRAAAPSTPVVTVRPSTPSAAGPVSGSSPTLATPSAAPLQPGVTSIKPEPSRRPAWPIALVAVTCLLLGTGATLLWARHVSETSRESSHTADRERLPKKLRREVDGRLKSAERHLHQGKLEDADTNAKEALTLLEAANLDAADGPVAEAARALIVRARVSFAHGKASLRDVREQADAFSTPSLHLERGTHHAYAAWSWDVTAQHCPFVHAIEAHRDIARAALTASKTWAPRTRNIVLTSAGSWLLAANNHAELALRHGEVGDTCKKRVRTLRPELDRLERDLAKARSKLR